jgi:hypothetical protein
LCVRKRIPLSGISKKKINGIVAITREKENKKGKHRRENQQNRMNRNKGNIRLEMGLMRGGNHAIDVMDAQQIDIIRHSRGLGRPTIEPSCRFLQNLFPYFSFFCDCPVFRSIASTEINSLLLLPI